MAEQGRIKLQIPRIKEAPRFKLQQKARSESWLDPLSLSLTWDLSVGV
jgi:hypothetical protein